MPIQIVAAQPAAAVRAYRARCRKHLAPPREASATSHSRTLAKEHRDDLHHPAAGRP